MRQVLAILTLVALGCSGAGKACDDRIEGFVIDEERMCASDPIVLGCRDRERYPYELAMDGCYTDGSGTHAFTWHQYGELPEQGWDPCESEYWNAFRAVSPDIFCD